MTPDQQSKWDRFWSPEGARPTAFGIPASYDVAARWLCEGLHKPCAIAPRLADWGCGANCGSVLRAVRSCGVPADWVRYIGIDCAWTDCATVRGDLAAVEVRSELALMRHVLEHNHDWRAILANFLQSFTERAALVIFTKWADETHLSHEDATAPYLRFRKADITEVLGDLLAEERVVKGESREPETVFMLGRA